MKININVSNPDEWKQVFPPAGGDKQWRDGYSAKELAKIVTGYYDDIDFEQELRIKLNRPKLEIIENKIFPERLSKFDNDWHGPRHHDLACCAIDDGTPVALCFEAKVYESLDLKLEKYRDSIGKIDRCNKLCYNFFGKKYDGNENEYKNIYYQILSSVAGTVAFACENNIQDAFFILYQILPKNRKENMTNKSNHINAINDFLRCKGVEKEINKSGDVVNIGDLTIEREQMTANVSIAYIEQVVSGK
ncbi:MAG: hypothetical protein J6V90_05185 [Treponema sp.]|nr:hypothetical protein [Treponema sp.]